MLLPTVPGVRMTRRLRSTLDLDETHDSQVVADSVGMTGDWRKKGPVYYVPFRTLTGVHTANLAAAGRCMSAGTTWDVMRAIPSCAVTGQAAGTAAALLARQGPTARFADLDIRALQQTLRQQNVPVDLPVPRGAAE